MKKFHIAVLRDPSNDESLYWVRAIEESEENITYEVINLTNTDWISKIYKGNFDLVLVRPAFLSFRLKNLYDEKLYVLTKVLGVNLYPTFDSCLIYENKRILSYFLDAYDIPHPTSLVFYDKKKAFDFINNAEYPIIGKVIIGASGLGVKILKNKREASRYITQAFGKGIRPKIGPDMAKPNLGKRIIAGLKDTKYLQQKLRNYFNAYKEKQTGFVFLQEFVPHKYEWRCVRIGESFFAHKKLVRNQMASGTLLKSYEAPSVELLNFVKEVSDKMGVHSAAFDIFEVDPNVFLVNEVQTIFGQADPYQMMINKKPGRFIFSNQKWVFEEGEFNKNKSYNLRLKHALNILTTNQVNQRNS